MIETCSDNAFKDDTDARRKSQPKIYDKYANTYVKLTFEINWYIGKYVKLADGGIALRFKADSHQHDMSSPGVRGSRGDEQSLHQSAVGDFAVGDLAGTVGAGSMDCVEAWLPQRWRTTRCPTRR